MSVSYRHHALLIMLVAVHSSNKFRSTRLPPVPGTGDGMGMAGAFPPGLPVSKILTERLPGGCVSRCEYQIVPDLLFADSVTWVV